MFFFLSGMVVVCLYLKAHGICNVAVVSGRCCYWEVGEEKKFDNIVLKKSSNVGFKLTDLLLWKIMNFIFADVIGLSWYNNSIQNPEGKNFVCVFRVS